MWNSLGNDLVSCVQPAIERVDVGIGDHEIDVRMRARELESEKLTTPTTDQCGSEARFLDQPQGGDRWRSTGHASSIARTDLHFGLYVKLGPFEVPRGPGQHPDSSSSGITIDPPRVWDVIAREVSHFLRFLEICNEILKAEARGAEKLRSLLDNKISTNLCRTSASWSVSQRGHLSESSER